MKTTAVALALTLLAVGCQAPVTVVTPQGQAAVTADAVTVRVNELMNAAIAADANGGLPRNTARTIVTWCVAADRTLQQPGSITWRSSLRTSWATLKTQLPKQLPPAITVAMATVDAALGVL